MHTGYTSSHCVYTSCLQRGFTCHSMCTHVHLHIWGFVPCHFWHCPSMCMCICDVVFIINTNPLAAAQKCKLNIVYIHKVFTQGAGVSPVHIWPWLVQPWTDSLLAPTTFPFLLLTLLLQVFDVSVVLYYASQDALDVRASHSVVLIKASLPGSRDARIV